MKPPSPDEVVRLFRLAQESDPDLATFIVLAASSGARRGELIALRWTDVDFARGTLSIERGIVLVDGKLIEQGTKTHQSRRITLDASTLRRLESHHTRMEESAALSRSDDQIDFIHIQWSRSTGACRGVRIRRPGITFTVQEGRR